MSTIVVVRRDPALRLAEGRAVVQYFGVLQHAHCRPRAQVDAVRGLFVEELVYMLVAAVLLGMAWTLP